MFATWSTSAYGLADAMLAARKQDGVHEQLVAALRDGRLAIDILMAQLIETDSSFTPTKSAAWPALVAIKAALVAVEA